MLKVVLVYESYSFAWYRWHSEMHPTALARRHGPDFRPIESNAVHISVVGDYRRRPRSD